MPLLVKAPHGVVHYVFFFSVIYEKPFCAKFFFFFLHQTYKMSFFCCFVVALVLLFSVMKLTGHANKFLSTIKAYCLVHKVLTF